MYARRNKHTTRSTAQQIFLHYGNQDDIFHIGYNIVIIFELLYYHRFEEENK